MGEGIEQEQAQVEATGWRSKLNAAYPAIRQARKLFTRFLHVCALGWMREIPLKFRATLVLRSSRALLFWRKHSDLCALRVYDEYVVPAANHDLFHHLSRRHYLSKKLSVRERADSLLTHYRFEDTWFDLIYKQHVYRSGGLLLWSKNVNGTQFELKLSLANRYAAEGDLSVFLLVDHEPLHWISFSWVNGTFASSKSPVVPFITANHGRWRKDHDVREKYNAAFPLNAPIFACFASLQGLAQALGLTEMLAVSCEQQVCYVADSSRHFGNAYDAFWESVGGEKLEPHGYLLPVPQPMKPLTEIAAKHRKRSATKRELLKEISDSSHCVMAAHYHGMPLSRAWPHPKDTGTGLTGWYYNDPGTGTKFTTLVRTRTDATVNFDWASGSPVPGVVKADDFSVRWTGQVQAPVAGNYTFSTVSDDGVRLWVNGALRINNWTNHAPTTNTSAPITLAAGMKYPVVMEYYERTGVAVARLRWAYAGQGTQAIPQSRLFP
jgi:uncharacterized protein VirK/YbjX